MLNNEINELEVSSARRRQIVVSVEVVLSHDGERRKVSAWFSFWHMVVSIEISSISSYLMLLASLSSYGSRVFVEVAMVVCYQRLSLVTFFFFEIGETRRP